MKVTIGILTLALTLSFDANAALSEKQATDYKTNLSMLSTLDLGIEQARQISVTTLACGSKFVKELVSNIQQKKALDTFEIRTNEECKTEARKLAIVSDAFQFRGSKSVKGEEYVPGTIHHSFKLKVPKNPTAFVDLSERVGKKECLYSLDGIVDQFLSSKYRPLPSFSCDVETLKGASYGTCRSDWTLEKIDIKTKEFKMQTFLVSGLYYVYTMSMEDKVGAENLTLIFNASKIFGEQDSCSIKIATDLSTSDLK